MIPISTVNIFDDRIIDEYGTVGRMRIRQEKPTYSDNPPPFPVPFRPPQISLT
jgi:hypothetical protein